MAMTIPAPMFLQIREPDIQAALEDAIAELDGSRKEVVLDFSTVGRLAALQVNTLMKLVDAAERKHVKLMLTGASVEVYKVLKLVNLSSNVFFEH
jgi:anti-anti-sigma regulatory factor